MHDVGCKDDCFKSAEVSMLGCGFCASIYP